MILRRDITQSRFRLIPDFPDGLALSDKELEQMEKGEFDEWMVTMINGIHSLAQQRLALERKTAGTRRTRTSVTLEEKEDELAAWLDSWRNADIRTMIRGLKDGRPLRRKNFQYIVNRIQRGDWWPLVSMIRAPLQNCLTLANYGMVCQAPPLGDSQAGPESS